MIFINRRYNYCKAHAIPYAFCTLDYIDMSSEKHKKALAKRLLGSDSIKLLENSKI